MNNERSTESKKNLIFFRLKNCGKLKHLEISSPVGPWKIEFCPKGLHFVKGAFMYYVDIKTEPKMDPKGP